MEVTPPDPVPQSLPVPETTPDEFTRRHCVLPVILESVRLGVVSAPEAVMEVVAVPPTASVFAEKLEVDAFPKVCSAVKVFAV
jgi:hypothetical protein